MDKNLKYTNELLQRLVDEGIIESLDAITDEKLEELVKMLKEEKDSLLKD